MAAITYSFQGVIFNVLADPRRTRPAYVNVIHIPGGNRSYIQSGGKGPKQLVYQVYLDVEHEFDYYVRLEDLLGTQGELNGPDGLTLQAVLTGFDRQDWFWHIEDPKEMTAVATFVIIEPPPT